MKLTENFNLPHWCRRYTPQKPQELQDSYSLRSLKDTNYKNNIESKNVVIMTVILLTI